MFSCITFERKFLRCCDCVTFFSSSLCDETLDVCCGILAISGKRPTIATNCSLEVKTTCFINKPMD